MLQELNETANGSAERQLYVLMYRMLAQNEIDNKLIVTRVEEIMKGKWMSVWIGFLFAALQADQGYSISN